MQHSVRLAQFPPETVFPNELQTRIRYDSSQQRLCFQGFMSKADFDKLCRLHNSLAYQRALEELFQQCVFEEPQAASHWGRTTYIVGAVALVAAALLVSLFYIPW